MHKPPMKQTVQQLYLTGKSIREISRILELSRNTVRAILRKKDADSPNIYPPKLYEHELIDLIKPLLISCKGNLVRVHEMLKEEHDMELSYSTLTHLVRKYQLRNPQSQRIGEYVFEPGVEMQHDTSPHWVEIDGKKTKAQCASLIFGFSRKLFIQYYPRFTRFEAKVFLHNALLFMDASCKRCIIDNTSVILAAGAGVNAVVAPEMLFFSRIFGFKFIAHAVNDPDRKGKIERPFSYAENNFLAGRTFRDWQDLNEQARAWCDNVANKKIKRVLGSSPDLVYQQERPYCLILPSILPPIYNHLKRSVNTEGYISVETHRYSVPERLLGKDVDVYQYIDRLDIFYQHRKVATHPRLTGLPYQRICNKEHHPTFKRHALKQAISETERLLTGHHATLDLYIQQLKSHVRGRGFHVFKQLLYFKQIYPMDAFMSAITTAQQYHLYDMKRLETIILRFISSDFFNF